MKPIVLTILDGWGYSKEKIGNAILNARTPVFDDLIRNYPALLLQASGKAVGITWGESGNSEVGHLAIGSGRIIFQMLSRINKSIETGDFFKNPAFLGAVDHVKQNQSKLHIAGLLTSGSVHSYFNHIIALMDFSARNGLERVYLHLFTDGKDSQLDESEKLLAYLNEYLVKFPMVKIATIIGRDFAMDRNKNWDLTQKAYNLLVGDMSPEVSVDPLLTVRTYHHSETYDSKMPPIMVNAEGVISDNDAVIFFNFREDSMRQLVSAFVSGGSGDLNVRNINNLKLVSMTKYFESNDIDVAFEQAFIPNTLTEVVSSAGKSQLHIAETEKYAHVTFFFNGLSDKDWPGEQNILIESYKNSSENPKMRVPEITSEIVNAINSQKHDLIVANFANADILSHTGNYELTVMGIEAIDSALGELKNRVLEADGILIVAADHGHAESMVYKGSGEIKTRHEANPVPFILAANSFKTDKDENRLSIELAEVRGLLSDIAPTILELFGIEKPVEMTGSSLISALGLKG